jgi:hypothetical protein
VTAQQIVIAAEVSVDSPDFGHVEPMVNACERELTAIGIDAVPEVVLADAGYWHHVQMDAIIGGGMQVLIPPDAGKRKGSAQTGTAASTRSCVACSPPSAAAVSRPSARA